MPLKHVRLPCGVERNKTRGETADFDDEIQVAFRMDLRIQQVLAGEAVRLQEMDVLLCERPEDRLQRLWRDTALIKRHVAIRREDVFMMQRTDCVQSGCDS